MTKLQLIELKKVKKQWDYISTNLITPNALYDLNIFNANWKDSIPKINHF